MPCRFQPGDAVRVTCNHHTHGEQGSVVSTSLAPSGRYQVLVQIGAFRFSYGTHEIAPVAMDNVIDRFESMKVALLGKAVA